jgi:hypothetical protein
MVTTIAILMTAGLAAAQSFTFPSGVEGLTKGIQFEIQGECHCARVYYTVALDERQAQQLIPWHKGGAELGYILTVYQDQSMKWGDGRKRDQVAERAIVQLLDIIVKQRFPHLEHWQDVFEK